MSRPYADPECPKCGGSGWIYAKRMITLPGEQGGRDCECTMDFHRRVNMERIWPSLSEASEVPKLRENPPLLRLASRDLWISAREEVFRAHLKAVCYRKSHLWNAKVWSDKDLVKAWLNTAYAQGHKIYDTELDDVRVTAMYIDELVESYQLVIFVLGVKEAPNKETPSVLLEALKTRKHLGRPSWIVDQLQRPLDVSHRAYSSALEGMLLHWTHVKLVGTEARVVQEGPVPARRDQDMVATVDPEISEKIDAVLSDLDEPGEVDESGEVEDHEEFVDHEVEASSGTKSLLANLQDNEEDAERRERRRRYSNKGNARKKGGRR